MARSERENPRAVESLSDSESLVLSDLLNHVFDRGVVISGSIVIGIADIDLVHLDLDLVIGSAEATRRALDRAQADLTEQSPPDADLPVLPPDRAD